jgi:FeS assembly SUF system protein
MTQEDATNSALSPVEKIQQQALESQIVEMIRTCFDPEIPVNVYDLGLIYGVELDEKNNVLVNMTLTSPACPVAGSLPIDVENKVKSVDGVGSVKVEIVWEPPWTPEKMSEAAKLQLNI